MSDFDRVREILAAATPGPWFRWHGDDDHCMNAYGITSEPCDHEFTSDDGHPSHVIALTLLQQPRLASLGHEPREVTLTDRNVDAMRWDENTDAIVTAVNLAPELIAVAEAAQDAVAQGRLWHYEVEALRDALDALHAKMKETLP